MPDAISLDRRSFLGAATVGITTAGMTLMSIGQSKSDGAAGPISEFSPVRQVKAGVLDVGYCEMGPSDGSPVLLLHGFPYSVDSYAEVAPILASRGFRVIVPYLRGHGSTRFLEGATPRSGQQGALGDDVVRLMDALAIDQAVLAGYDWGGRAACVVAALWPERCAGLVSVNSYLIQDIANAGQPLPPSIESGLWYQYYFQTERGRAGLTANPL